MTNFSLGGLAIPGLELKVFCSVSERRMKLHVVQADLPPSTQASARMTPLHCEHSPKSLGATYQNQKHSAE
ncbi:hypothetical protein SERLADRAFT_441193 [Serpula lacrymans var. lacrymans S7.9]|uniref:Uncharacterized protein n=1 Tax=Serpula lacrymans var. lacrymans (strain S7.9) TaxID=578457 RepID=F8P5T8_SERL9|nr:uncharacterized protein SERLADRAFT_441193 [Serpula lacrymans var. lacrymans S7.9]EGO21975.1 hypothetical protein SERLADRAFT_441193 [Serpula lacrymans var. lacrymans S7.9]